MSSLGSISVLHVDDEQYILDITKKYLEMLDDSLEVTSTDSPMEALQLIASGDFDCIISDYAMPPMNGIELAAEIREGSSIPIILYTGRGSDEVAFKAFTAGVDDYIKKEGDAGHYQVLVQRIKDAVKRKKAEIALSKSGSALQDFVDLSPDSYYIFDENMVLIKFNQRAKAFMPNLETGRPMLEMYPGLKGTGRYDAYCKVLETGEPMEEKIVEYGGETGTRRRHLIRKAFRAGNHLAIIVTDISNQVDIESNLQRQEALYRDLVDMLPQIVFEMDKDGHVTLLNTPAYNLLGFTFEELQDDRYLSKIFDPEDREEAVATMRRLLEGMDRPKSYEFVLQDVDGEKIPSEFYVRTVERMSSIIGLRGIIVDLREKIRAENDLRRSEENYRKILNTSPNAVILSVKGTIDYANMHTARMLGYEDTSEIVGRSVLNLIPEELHPIFLDYTGKKLRGDDVPDSYELGLLHKDGRVVPVENHVTLVDIDGEFSTLIFSRDITVRKMYEEEMRRHSEELERLVEEKSMELVEAEKMVTAGRIAAMIAHDLKGPLQTMSNSLFLLENTPEHRDEMIEMIRSSIDRANNMIEEFRSRTRDTPVEYSKMDVKALIETVMREQTIPGGIEVSLDIDDFEPVMLDGGKIHRVLENLLRNAVEAMQGKGELTVEARVTDEALTLKVSDTGKGIPEDLMANLFKPFITSKPRGLGLGLPYCKRAVEAHGGTIKVDSRVGQGTAFEIIIPLDHSENEKVVPALTVKSKE